MATFSGGEKLERKLAEMARGVTRASTLEVGFLEGATYPAKIRRSKGAMSKRQLQKLAKRPAVIGSGGTRTVPFVAFMNEFGHRVGADRRASVGGVRVGRDRRPIVPPRPFFRTMIAEKSGGWGRGVATLLKANNYDAQPTLDLMGTHIAGQLRESIVKFSSPPLAQSTIDAKGFDKPLVDTGHMLQSVDHEVKS